jgi:signal transduction histidine kinase
MHQKYVRFCLPFLLGILFLLSSKNLSAKTNTLDSLMDLTVKHLDNNQYDWAFRVMEECERLINTNEESEQVARYLSLKSSVEGKKGNYAAQLELLEKYRDLAFRLNNPRIIAESQISFASYYEQFDDFRKALPYFLKALDQFQLLGSEPEIAYLYNKLGIIYYSDADYKVAQTYFFASYCLFFKHKDEAVVNAYWVQNCLSNIGLCYLKMNNPRKALAFMKIALNFCKTGPFKRERPIAVIQTQIGLAFGKLGQTQNAISYFKEGIKGCLIPENDEQGHGIESIINLADIYTESGNYAEAESQLKQALKLSIDWEINGLLGNYYNSMAKLKLAKKDYSAAYTFLILANNYADSVDLALEKTVYSRQILIHNLDKQKMENDILKAENEYKSLVNKVIAGIVLLFVIAVFTFYLTLKKSKARNTELENLNTKILDQKKSLIELNNKLSEVNQNKSYLLQSIAHDLRTPIGNVVSLNQLLEDVIEPNTEEANYLKLIQSSCMLALNIIEDILDQSMIERSKLQLKFAPVNIHQIIDESIHLLYFRSEPKQITILRNFSSLPSMEADGDRIKRVFLNILMNAIKFSSKGSKITITQTMVGSFCQIAFTDEGIGMDENIVSQIFDRNTIAAREGVNKEKTIGIGLSIARLIVEEHGGKIKVESQPNSGSTFYIELPASI